MMRAMYVMCVMMPGPLRGMLAMREAGPSEEGLDATRPAAHGSKKSRSPYLGPRHSATMCAAGPRPPRCCFHVKLALRSANAGPPSLEHEKDRGCYTPARHAPHPYLCG